MELDELKRAWRELDRRMERSAALELRVFRELKLDKTRSALRRLAVRPVVDLLQDVPLLLLLGSFLAGHVREPEFAAPAVLLMSAVLLAIVSDARQLAMIGGIDYTAPVVAIQRRLAELRALRIRTTQWTLLLAPLLWIPLLIVGARGLLHVDLYRAFGPQWLAANIAFGLAVIPLVVWITRRNAAAFRNSPILKRLADDIAGRSLLTARAHLDQIAQFEAESGAGA